MVRLAAKWIKTDATYLRSYQVKPESAVSDCDMYGDFIRPETHEEIDNVPRLHSAWKKMQVGQFLASTRTVYSVFSKNILELTWGNDANRCKLAVGIIKGRVL